MKLFYLPSACSLAPHIVFQELDLPYQLERVDVKNKAPLLAYNPKGYVPTLILDDGQVLTEVAVVLQYLADLKPEANLVPRPGEGMARYRCQEWLNYIATELHKVFYPLFHISKQLNEESKQTLRAHLKKQFAWLDQHFASNTFFLGEHYTIADIYGFVVISWAQWLHIDTDKLENLTAFLQRVRSRPATQAAMAAEKR